MIEFQRGHLHGRCIVIDAPVNDVIGIVECAKKGCKWRKVLMIEDDDKPDKLGVTIENFLKDHPCGKDPFS
jgi:hypothetical protein